MHLPFNFPRMNAYILLLTGVLSKVLVFSLSLNLSGVELIYFRAVQCFDTAQVLESENIYYSCKGILILFVSIFIFYNRHVSAFKS